jgi:hypothetical protein
MHQRYHWLTGLALLLTLPNIAQAQSLPASGNLVSNEYTGKSITFYWGEGPTYGEPSTTLTTWAGAFVSQFSASTMTTTVNLSQPLLFTYCVQIEVFLGTNQPVTTRTTGTNASDWKSQPPNNNTTGEALAYLYNTFGQTSSTDTSAVFKAATAADRQARAAALQLAFWEVAEDFTGPASSIGFGGGIIRSISGTTDATVLNYATTYTNSLKTALGGTLTGSTNWLDGIATSTSGQDLITSSAMVVIPEPASLALLGLGGFLGLPLLRRRR